MGRGDRAASEAAGGLTRRDSCAELVVFAAATAAFVAVGQTAVAVVFAVLAVMTAALVRVWPEPVA